MLSKVHTYVVQCLQYIYIYYVELNDIYIYVVYTQIYVFKHICCTSNICCIKWYVVGLDMLFNKTCSLIEYVC